MKKIYFFILLGYFASATAQVTPLVTNIADPGGAGIGNRVVFVNFATGELGSTDGTVAGTVFIPASTVILAGQNAVRLGNKIVFVGFNAVTGNELWSSDGTVAGTSIIKDINVTGSSNPQGASEGFTLIGNTIYFTADDGINGRELWKTDGTLAGTTMVKDLNASVLTFASPVGTEAIGSTLFFTANVGTDGLELWKTDGTSAGTVMVKNITSGIASTAFSKYFVGNGTYVWFVANDGVNGYELWRTDGTSAGTIMLQNISGTDAFSLFTGGGTSDWNGIVFNGTLYFNPNGASIGGNQLWKSNGTSAGTSLVTSLSGSGAGMNLWESIMMGGKFYFNANGTAGNELYASDGTAAGTMMIKDINPTGSSNPRILMPRENLGDFYDRRPFRGKIMFLAEDGTNGYELWASDGTTAGTTLVKNINPTGSAFATSGDVRYFYTHYKLFIVADNGTNGAELWETDATNGGTVMMQDIWTGSSSSSVDIFGVAEANNKLVFRANNGDGFDIYALNASVVPFPLTLTAFSGQVSNGRAELKWTTHNEINFSHFNLQRSLTGTDFITISRIAGKGGAANHYGYADNLNKGGTFYYRLQMVDNDGKSAYSNVVTVQLKAGFNFNLVATRSDAVVSLSDVDGIVSIKLIDLNGRVLTQQVQKAVSGEVIRLPIAHLSSGLYLIVAEHDGVAITQRFVR